MAKLIMLMVIIGTVAIPITTAQKKTASKSTLRTTQILVGVVILAWGWLVTHVYPQLVPLD
jgi:hypothetical protein